MIERGGNARRRQADVLHGTPSLEWQAGADEAAILPSRADQLRELLDLVDRGLLSEEELARQQAKIPGP